MENSEERADKASTTTPDSLLPTGSTIEVGNADKTGWLGRGGD